MFRIYNRLNTGSGMEKACLFSVQYMEVLELKIPDSISGVFL